jgi:hypothetical protein
VPAPQRFPEFGIGKALRGTGNNREFFIRTRPYWQFGVCNSATVSAGPEACHLSRSTAGRSGSTVARPGLIARPFRQGAERVEFYAAGGQA